MINRFNIRVYGILTHADKILLVHEKIGDFEFTKFPGGGLEFGEGISDCLKREFKEETGLDIEVTSHLYTTDFFQQSAFKSTDQLIAIYYHVRAVQDPGHIRLDEHDVWNDGRVEQMRFFWVKKQELTSAHLTFPIDKHVLSLL